MLALAILARLLSASSISTALNAMRCRSRSTRVTRSPATIEPQKVTRDVRICVSDEINVPVAVGIFDAMILLPCDLVHELDATISIASCSMNSRTCAAPTIG